RARGFAPGLGLRQAAAQDDVRRHAAQDQVVSIPAGPQQPVASGGTLEQGGRRLALGILQPGLAPVVEDLQRRQGRIARDPPVEAVDGGLRPHPRQPAPQGVVRGDGTAPDTRQQQHRYQQPDHFSPSTTLSCITGVMVTRPGASRQTGTYERINRSASACDPEEGNPVPRPSQSSGEDKLPAFSSGGLMRAESAETLRATGGAVSAGPPARWLRPPRRSAQ